ncbi:family 78 glycoside hydrolase catalytic domain [Streptococcus plurextorum]|uniref:family 78 glycoside hydrolase catalytic domain n=1 Tax=Streptococcus plurextorum TaxID=456876 RepID=UPI000418A0E3|nr:family 78 glycoside hydrolase catalytic domain [Streptococcus plurextorum]
MKAIQLRTNHMDKPIGISPYNLLLSWNCEDDISQTAYHIQLYDSETMIWDSGKINSADMQVFPNITIPYATQIRWSIRLWNEQNHPGPWESTWFETGLDLDSITVTWVEPELDSLRDDNDECSDTMNDYAKQQYTAWKMEGTNQNTPPILATKDSLPSYHPHQPASYLRKYFNHQKTGQERLYITAKGLYVAYLNGRRVGNMVLAPGTFSSDVHLGVQTYDISNLLINGDNELSIVLGDGWHRSTSGVDGDRNLFGDKVAVWFRLESKGQLICESDSNMEASQSGAIRQNDLQHGEIYDARLEKITDWHPVQTNKTGPKLVHQDTVWITEHERFVGETFLTPNGETVIDFGQNLAGYPEITVTAHEGQWIRLYCGETLDEHGNFTQENFRDASRHKEGGALQMIELICKEGQNIYKPSFTIMGFQYAKVETNIDLTNASFTSIAVYSDMEELLSFDSSHRELNQLVSNSLWSMKSNFCDVPTDCPTRERAAWTGDVAIFIDTALYLMNCVPIVSKWLGECRICQYPDGRLANIAPKNSRGSFMTDMLCMSAGWGDSCILTPYALYKRTRDITILRRSYQMMKKWYAFLEARAQQTSKDQEDGPYAKYTVLNGLDYGEWCEPGITAQEAMMNPRKTVGTAYLAYSGRLLSEIAELLGEEQDAIYYRKISHLAKKAYRHAFTHDGRIKSDRQAEYVRALAFDLLSDEEARVAASDLNDLVMANDYHLNTGFLSTPYLCKVLSDYGFVETAYRLLLQDTAPSWLFAIKKGANTIWETWDGIDESGRPSESLNHYAYGAICQWIFEDLCGIRYEFGKLMIHPKPYPLLEHISMTYKAPCGVVTSGWKYSGNEIIYTVTVPTNVTAEFMTSTGQKHLLTSGIHTIIEKGMDVL